MHLGDDKLLDHFVTRIQNYIDTPHKDPLSLDQLRIYMLVLLKVMRNVRFAKLKKESLIKIIQKCNPDYYANLLF